MKIENENENIEMKKIGEINNFKMKSVSNNSNMNDEKKMNFEKRINLWKDYILIAIRLNYRFVLYVIENDLKLDIDLLLIKAYNVDTRDYYNSNNNEKNNENIFTINWGCIILCM